MVLDKLNFDQLIIISIIFLLVLILLFSIILRKKPFKQFRLAFLLAHSLFVLVITGFVYSYNSEAQAQLLWIIVMYIDFAVSWLFRITRLWSFLYDSVIIWPFTFFMLVGGFQYYILGNLLDYFVKMKQENKGK